jgi:hypothetical protein
MKVVDPSSQFLYGCEGRFMVDRDTKFHVYLFNSIHLADECDLAWLYSFHSHWARSRLEICCICEGESNENLKIAIKIRNRARLSCKLTTMILMVWRVADRWQYDAGTQHDGAVLVLRWPPRLQHVPKKNSIVKGWKSIEIRRPMKVQYCDACLSLQQVYEWTKKFMNGISSVTDWHGPAHRVVTPEVIAAVETIVN